MRDKYDRETTKVLTCYTGSIIIVFIAVCIISALGSVCSNCHEYPFEIGLIFAVIWALYFMFPLIMVLGDISYRREIYGKQ